MRRSRRGAAAHRPGCPTSWCARVNRSAPARRGRVPPPGDRPADALLPTGGCTAPESLPCPWPWSVPSPVSATPRRRQRARTGYTPPPRPQPPWGQRAAGPRPDRCPGPAQAGEEPWVGRPGRETTDQARTRPRHQAAGMRHCLSNLQSFFPEHTALSKHAKLSITRGARKA